MKILVYEFVTGGGWYAVDDRQPPPVSLAVEGRAMLTAIAADFAALDGTQVVALVDRRYLDTPLTGCRVVAIGSACAEHDALCAEAEQADWTVLIAPEFDHLLLERCRWVIESGGRLLGPGLELVALAGDKHATAERLLAAGVPAPRGVVIAAGEQWPRDFPWPAVWKPRDGAGSLGVRLIRDASEWRAGAEIAASPKAGRLEEYCPGISASVAWLCGPAGHYPLLPCRQHLSDNGSFAYQGGSLPLPPPLAERAVGLTRAALRALPDALGYVGFDIVLGPADDGRQDVVIEVNPRPTTSYVGLRAAAESNLAAAWLDVAAGRRPKIRFRSSEVRFTANGTATVTEESNQALGEES